MQGLLFDLPYECQRECAAEIRRMSKQVRQIYDRLLSGPASNNELAGICLKYTGRVSELRKQLREHGYDVECYDRNRATGLCWYRLSRGHK